MGACVGFALASFVAVAVLRWPLAWVLLGLGAAACGWAWHRLAPARG
jgi:chromate transporter